MGKEKKTKSASTELGCIVQAAKKVIHSATADTDDFNPGIELVRFYTCRIHHCCFCQ